MATRATLDGFGADGAVTPTNVELPIQFSYQPPTPQIRHTVHKTADGGIVVHGADNAASSLPADAKVIWTMEGASRSEWYDFMKLYTAAVSQGLERTFVGYWGESFEVLCLVMSPPQVRGGVFDFGGEFLIKSVSSWGTRT